MHSYELRPVTVKDCAGGSSSSKIEAHDGNALDLVLNWTVL